MLTQKRTLYQWKRKPPLSMWECWMEASALTMCYRRSPLKVLMNIYLLYKAICATGKCLFLFWVFFFVFSHSFVSDSLRPHGLQHARPSCPSPTVGAYSNSCPSCQWCHPTISSSVISFPSCLQSFPASGSFPVSQFFPSRGQSIGVSASTSVLPMNIRDWFL